ncbi:MAG: phytase [Fimbriimonadaceae bacterium]|nr:phytase [Fimbriimonadaceae bacterium]
MRVFLPVLLLVAVGCQAPAGESASGGTPAPADQAQAAVTPLSPIAVTEPVPHDADDPAIWIHPTDPAKSRIWGTDKNEVSGGLYAFDLAGKVVQSITPLDRPNNVDIIQWTEEGSPRALMVATERAARRIRIYEINAEGEAVEASGSAAFLPDAQGDEGLPMGVALTRSSETGAITAFVSPKTGPAEGYLARYELKKNSAGKWDLELKGRFGSFSGMDAEQNGEIEALVVDRETGELFFSDELFAIRRVASAVTESTEAPPLGEEIYQGDREGLAVIRNEGRRLLLSSDQLEGGSRLMVWDISGETPRLLVAIPTPADATDGLEAVTAPLGEKLPAGVLVMMNSKDRNFMLFDLREVLLRLPDPTPVSVQP